MNLTDRDVVRLIVRAELERHSLRWVLATSVVMAWKVRRHGPEAGRSYWQQRTGQYPHWWL